MKPSAFDYVRARSPQQVFDLLAQHGEDARVLAGGQTLLPALAMRLSAPTLLVDIGALDGLRGITVHGGSLRIGALTRHVEIESSALVALHAPLLAQAAPHIAHPAIRNRGTFGGSLAYADPSAEWPACVLALDGTLVLQGAKRRTPRGRGRLLPGPVQHGPAGRRTAGGGGTAAARARRAAALHRGRPSPW
jgi:carbon-monoxide dehydrogenase medium subunit